MVKLALENTDRGAFTQNLRTLMDTIIDRVNQNELEIGLIAGYFKEDRNVSATVLNLISKIEQRVRENNSDIADAFEMVVALGQEGDLLRAELLRANEAMNEIAILFDSIRLIARARTLLNAGVNTPQPLSQAGDVLQTRHRSVNVQFNPTTVNVSALTLPASNIPRDNNNDVGNEFSLARP